MRATYLQELPPCPNAERNPWNTPQGTSALIEAQEERFVPVSRRGSSRPIVVQNFFEELRQVVPE